MSLDSSTSDGLTAPVSPIAATWSSRYGQKHRLRRLREFPPGIRPPQRVRIYERNGDYVLQWWDPTAKRTLCDRVAGDLLAALSRAREMDDRLTLMQTGGCGRGRLSHKELIAAYIADLERRANAGEIDVRTVERYRAALRYYLDFVVRPSVAKRFPWAARADRNLALEFAAHLREVEASRNGHIHGTRGRLASAGYVLDVVRSAFAWGADPLRGAWLPSGFVNPFLGSSRRESAMVLFGEPDVTLAMAEELIRKCDAWQLAPFALLALYGLRPGEIGFVLREHLAEGWLHVACQPKFDYRTKGRRDKRLPLPPIVERLLRLSTKGSASLLIGRRNVRDGRARAPAAALSTDELYEEFQRRKREANDPSPRTQRRLRDHLFRDAGGLNYDDLVREFEALRDKLGWSSRATLKDFRHLAATCLENAGVPDFYRRYLLGQSPGRSAIAHYTHINELKQRYEEAVERQFSPLLRAIDERSQELGIWK